MSKEYGTFAQANEWKVLRDSFVAAAEALKSEHPEDAYTDLKKVADQFEKFCARQKWVEDRDAALKEWEKNNPQP